MKVKFEDKSLDAGRVLSICPELAWARNWENTIESSCGLGYVRDEENNFLLSGCSFSKRLVS